MSKTTPSTPARALRRLADLTLDPQNANKGTDRGRAALERSLREYGAGRAVLLDRHGHIIAGNKTVESARALNLRLRVVKTDGTYLIAVQREDLDLLQDPRAKALAIADNRVGELDLEWDVAMLKQLRAEGLDLSAFWTDQEFAALLTEDAAGLTDENAVIAPGETSIRPGELFVLGRHRLLCGDATSASDVARLLDGMTPLLMTTDPPYGVSYDPVWRHAMNPSQRTAVGRVANDDRADWTAAWRLFPGTVAYIWHAALKAASVAADLETAGFRIRSQIIWAKQHFALSRGDYHWAHEPAWYVVRHGAKSHWCGDRTQTTVWEVPSLNAMGGTRTADNAVTGHGTQKPVRLFEIPIRNHTTERDLVYDPFCGSGTALIAAENRTRVRRDGDRPQVRAGRHRSLGGLYRKASRTAGVSRGADGRPPMTELTPKPRPRPARGGKNGHEPRTRIRYREERAMEMAGEGLSQAAIASALEISQPAVSRIFKRLAARAAEERSRKQDQHLLILEQRFTRLYRLSMEGFAKSQEARTRKRQRRQTRGEQETVTVEVSTDAQSGDPRFLEQGLNAVTALGRLQSPAPSPTGARSISSLGPVPIEQATDKLLRLLNRERQRMDEIKAKETGQTIESEPEAE